MDNTTPPPSGEQQNQPLGDTPQGAETERIVISPSPDAGNTPPAAQPYTEQQAYTPPPQNYGASQPTVPMSGPPPVYQQPTEQTGAPQQGYAPPSAPQYQQYQQQQPYPPQQQQQQPQQQPYPQQPPQYQQPYPPQQTTVVAPKKGGMPVWAMVLIGLFVALLLACGLIYYLVNRAVSGATTAITNAGDAIGATVAVGGFDIALTTGDYEEAHKMLGSDLANKYSVADLQNRWEALSGSGTVNTRMSDVKMSGNRPQIVWTLTPGDGGSAKNVTLTLAESNGDWKIVDASPELLPSP